MKLYATLISAFMLISFSSFAEGDGSTIKNTRGTKKKQLVIGKRAAESGIKSSVYNRDGLVKRKGSKKSCPAFVL